MSPAACSVTVPLRAVVVPLGFVTVAVMFTVPPDFTPASTEREMFGVAPMTNDVVIEVAGA